MLLTSFLFIAVDTLTVLMTAIIYVVLGIKLKEPKEFVLFTIMPIFLNLCIVFLTYLLIREAPFAIIQESDALEIGTGVVIGYLLISAILVALYGMMDEREEESVLIKVAVATARLFVGLSISLVLALYAIPQALFEGFFHLLWKGVLKLEKVFIKWEKAMVNRLNGKPKEAKPEESKEPI